ncbi:transposable element Tcb2 transposase [Trichonephila clavipes]|nr:transposable element Tcb2 transposase [Trichonephila clavipes]
MAQLLDRFLLPTRAGCQDLREFESGVIVGTRKMGHDISEVAMKFEFSRTTISRVYCEYQKHIAWSDESGFQLNRADGHVRVWRQPNESMDPTWQQGTVQAGGGFVMEHSSEFRHFLWPPKSPDMNIIEYIWDAFQRAVQKRSPPPLIPTDLWTALQYSWCQLPPELINTLIESIPRRVVTLLCARGSPTRY